MMAQSFTLVLFACTSVYAAEEAGKIMRPVDNAALPSDQVDIIATAPDGKLELDGKPLLAEQPFPNVLHINATVSPGVHSLALLWKDGRKEIKFFAGPNPPPKFEAYRSHPPVKNVQCTQCHEVTRRGRFHFKGACFDCHVRDSFAKVHTHTPEVLTECGLCHNAHGSTVKAHLLYSKEIACKQCHN